MGIVWVYFSLMLSLLIPHHCGAEATDDDQSPMVERINQRYDDFFRRQRAMEEEERQRDKKANEIKRVREEHEKRIEEARREYVKSRRKVVEDPRLEQQWLEHEKDVKQQNDQFRKRYVKRRDAVEAIRRKGRRIPEMKEYDLEE
jgi:hypothetical protein